MTQPKDQNSSENCSETADNRQLAAPDGKNESSTGAPIDTQLTRVRSPDVLVSYPRLPDGWTYFVQRQDEQIKIGFSSKPRHRINGLTAEHGPLKVLAVVPAAVAGEFQTHQKFDHLRTEGEWFVAGADLLRFIEEVKVAPMPAPQPSPRPDYNFSQPKVRLNPAKTISKMLKMRSRIGADTPAGHRISNIDEIRQNLARAMTPDQADYLEASLARQLRDLEIARQSSTQCRGEPR
jgi:hypothetical protein